MTGGWWYLLNGEQKGPVGPDELVRLLANGTIVAQSLVWTAGMKNWQTAAEIHQLAPLLRTQPPEIPSVDQQKGLSGVWRRVQTHLGSSAALVVGCLAVISGLLQIAQTGASSNVDAHKGNLVVAGAAMVLGALAYRSAKKRMLSEAKTTLLRQVVELVLLALLCAVVLAQNNLIYLVTAEPVPHLIVPIWAIMAYLVVVCMPRASNKSSASRY